MKQILIRSASLLILVLICLALFYTGKGHTLLLDNKNIERNGTEYKALNIAEVQIDRGDTREILKRDRLKEEVTGQRHRISITYLDKGIEKTYEKSFSIEVGEPMYILNIPALLAEEDFWIQPFEPLN